MDDLNKYKMTIEKYCRIQIQRLPTEIGYKFFMPALQVLDPKDELLQRLREIFKLGNLKAGDLLTFDGEEKLKHGIHEQDLDHILEIGTNVHTMERLAADAVSVKKLVESRLNHGIFCIPDCLQISYVPAYVPQYTLILDVAGIATYTAEHANEKVPASQVEALVSGSSGQIIPAKYVVRKLS